MIRQDSPARVAGIGETTSFAVDMQHGTRLVVNHITPATGTGYVSVAHCASAEGTYVPHHGDGVNIQSANCAAGAATSSVFRSCFRFVRVTVNVGVAGTGGQTVEYEVLP